MNNSNYKITSKSDIQIKDEQTITDPSLVLTLLHKKKRKIINLLLKKAMTIQEIKKATKINPGTIKRHIDDLMSHDLIFISEQRLNDYNIKMKYYRATAKKFYVRVELPEKN